MNGFVENLKMEMTELEKEIGHLKNTLQDAPKGRIEIKKNRSRIQYYYAREETPYKLQYIRKCDEQLAINIVQRDYSQNVLKCLEQRYKIVNAAFEVYEKTDTRKRYKKTNAERKKLITPRKCDLSNDEYVRAWLEIPYQGKVFALTDPEIYTVKGERVRSKSEKIIADALERKGVPYRYECPICLSGGIHVYPDFTVLNKQTRDIFYIEHFGMMDNPEYAEKVIRKIEEYEKNGIFPGKQLLMTFETKNRPLNTSILCKMISEYLL